MSESESPINVLMSIEEELRELATELQRARVGRDTYVYDMTRIVDKLRSIGEKLTELSLNPLLRDVVPMLKDLVEAAYSEIEFYCYKNDGTYTCNNIPTKLLRSIIYKLSREIGRKCGNLIIYEDYVQPPAILDGLANCIHVVAEEVGKIVSEGRRVGRCILLGNVDPRIVQLCEKWSKLVEEYHSMGIYLEEDYNMLIGVGRGSKIDLRVGSSPGHAMKIDLEKGELKYFDNDRNVIDVVKTFITHQLYGSCTYDYSSSELSCRFDPGAEDVVDKLAWLAANVTSLDANLDTVLPDYLKARVVEAIENERLSYDEALKSVEELVSNGMRKVALA